MAQEVLELSGTHVGVLGATFSIHSTTTGDDGYDECKRRKMAPMKRSTTIT
tara:strand:+ start:130 stop:282 length:153 start_codon:yes stop_codon:yes gene_type:complete